MSSDDQARVAVQAALDKKALDPVLLDVRGTSSYTDFILLVSATSDRHVQAVGDSITEALVKRRVRPVGVEGQKGGHWTLLDFGDVVVHVFYQPLREFYDLEGLWCDAPRVALEVPPELRSAPAAF